MKSFTKPLKHYSLATVADARGIIRGYRNDWKKVFSARDPMVIHRALIWLKETSS